MYHAIYTRRSIRRFEPRPVPREVLLRLLDAATWAPSAHNRQPWRFVVLESEASKRLLADTMAAQLAADLRADGVSEEAIAKDTGRSRQRLTGAGALVVVCLTMADMDTYPDERRQSFEHQMAVQGVAMAAQNLLLAAHAEGLGAVWMCAPLFCQAAVREALDLPPDYEPQGVIALGYPAEERTRSREPLETRVVFR
ncbi:MAG: nitroreductase family protein [Chloroflexi bacterium]|nr:nitroreductase family protein [Chloroflexota bacterium]